MGNCDFQIICNLFVSLLLLSLIAIGTTNASEPHCTPQIKVPRNTVIKAREMTVLKINCSVIQHGCHRRPRISWCKINVNDCNDFNHSDYIKTEWKNITGNEWIAFLTFLNISMEDAGLYRCRVNELSISHSINVNVTYNNKYEFSPTPSNTSKSDDQQRLRLYVYICGGTAGLVFINITITLLYVIRCQGRKSTRIEMVNKNQYIKTQKSDLLLLPHLYLNPDLLTSVIYRVGNYTCDISEQHQ